MAASKLDASVRRIVKEHGLGNVLAALAKVADGDGGNGALATPDTLLNGAAKPASARARKAAPKPTASGYVAKMDLPDDKRRAMAELAERFDGNEFMPSFGDVRAFCESYGIDVPASRTRASALPRVFKFLAGMDAAELQRMLDYRMHSGPSRLGPISDAIRNYGKARQAASRAGQAPVRARASARRAATSAGDSASA